MHDLRLQDQWERDLLDFHLGVKLAREALDDLYCQRRVDEFALQLDLVTAGEVADVGEVISDLL